MPVSLGVLLASQAIPAIAGGLSHRRNQKDLQAMQSDFDRERIAAMERAKGFVPDFTLGNTAREAFMRTQQDAAGDIARREAERGAASTIDALGRAGSKAAIGGAAGAAFGSGEAISRSEADSQARRMKGESAFADLEEGMRGQQREFDLMRMGREFGLADQATSAIQAVRGQSMADRRNFERDLIGMGSDVTGMLANYGSAEDGAKVKETPGEFSHNTNPIHLIRKGTKVGEVTGGELIFNPDQSETLESLAQKGDSDLHKYLRKLLQEFNNK